MMTLHLTLIALRGLILITPPSDALNGGTTP